MVTSQRWNDAAYPDWVRPGRPRSITAPFEIGKRPFAGLFVAAELNLGHTWLLLSYPLACTGWHRLGSGNGAAPGEKP